MPQVRIVKAFTLTRDNGQTEYFDPALTNMDEGEPGNYELSEEDAEHWYVKAHSSKPPKPDMKANSQEGIEMQARQAAVARSKQFVAHEDEQKAMADVRQRRVPRATGVMGEAAKDPIATPSPDGAIGRATPPGDDGTEPQPSTDPLDHDAPR